MKRITFLGAFFAFLTVSPASADDAYVSDCRGAIPRAEALKVASGYGMVRVTEIECDDGHWENEGRDHRGRELEIEIDSRGRVISVKRGDDDDDD